MSDIVKKTEEYAVSQLSNALDTNYLYHNLQHTYGVVKNTKQLLNFYSLNEKEKERLLLAAWLHDLGYTQAYANHEDLSCGMATSFLKKQDYDEKGIKMVTDLIMATKRYHRPDNLNEQIIRDADAAHFGSDNFSETSELLRKELALLGIAQFDPTEWRSENIKMLETEHAFHTEYAQQHWQLGKKKNLKKLKKERKAEKNIAKKEGLKAKYKNESPDRGIQTLFRVTLKNHLTLSDIADTKANILLSVNAIIVSVVLSNLIPKLDNPSNTYLIYPTVIFLIFSVASIILAVLATRPNVTSGQFTKEDVKNKKVNLLFFGNFHKMKLDEYEWAIQELVKDKEYIYNSLTKDLYFLGLVLNRKYKILRSTYTIFMVGIIVSVIAFAVAFRYFGPERMG